MTGAPVRFVFDPELAAFQLTPEHPFKPVRYELVRTLLLAAGVLTADEVAEARFGPDGWSADLTLDFEARELPEDDDGDPDGNPEPPKEEGP